MAHSPAKPASRRRRLKAPAFCGHRLEARIGEDELRQAGFEVGVGVEEVGHALSV